MARFMALQLMTGSQYFVIYIALLNLQMNPWLLKNPRTLRLYHLNNLNLQFEQILTKFLANQKH